MSTPAVTPSPSITWKDKKPSWDFAQTTAYPVELQQGSKTPTVYVHLTPYTPDELKDILKKAVSGYKREKRDVEIVREDRSIYQSLLDAHFVRFGKAFKKVGGKNVPTTPADDRAFIDKYPEHKSAIVEHTFGGLRMDPPKTDEDDDDVLDISTDLSGAVHVYQELYDDASTKVVRVDMVHNHAHPTEALYREYRNARRSKFLRKSSLWTITEQHGTLEKLYDSVIKSIEGAMVNGKPCDAETKTEWLSFVPLWHKLWVVDHIFGELVEKNV